MLKSNLMNASCKYAHLQSYMHITKNATKKLTFQVLAIVDLTIKKIKQYKSN